jgi:hypothetical protein
METCNQEALMHRIILLVLLLSYPLCAQRQLVVIKNDRVVQRIYQGQTFRFETKKSETIQRQFLVEADELSFITNHDSVKIQDLVRISSGKRNTFLSLAGQFMITAGVGYFLLDEINRITFQHDSGKPDPQVLNRTALLIGIGIPLRFMKKQWDEPGKDHVQIRSVDYKSRFYREK